MISPELASFIEGGVDIHVGTRDERNIPNTAFAIAAWAEDAGASLSIVLAAAPSTKAIANLRQNGKAAVCFFFIPDHRTVQIKGTLISLRDGDASDVARAEQWRARFGTIGALVGFPTALLDRVILSPCVVAKLRVESLFDQTPGPGAGRPLENASPSPA